jgi:glycosyltransferase involved in cell wall biosynthesis
MQQDPSQGRLICLHLRRMAGFIARLRVRLNRALKLHRALLALRCVGPLRPGATVVIVNWNSLRFLSTTIRAVKHFSPTDLEIIVVDNGSTDGSIEWFRSQGIRHIALDTNIGHAGGLDRGFAAARTKVVIALDVDAFPISTEWIPTLQDFLQAGRTVAGAHARTRDRTVTDRDNQVVRDFVHPCCLAMTLRRYAFKWHSFARVFENGRLLKDPGEVISERESGRLGFLEETRHLGPGYCGSVFRDMVFHNGFSTRHEKEGRHEIDGVTPDAVAETWENAVKTYLQSI